MAPMNKAFLFFLLGCTAIVAQTPSTGRVILYHPRDAYAPSRTLNSSPVVIDKRELPVHLKIREYYQVDLAPGRHVFRGSDKNSPTGLDVEAGKTYYLRAEWHSVMMGFQKTVYVPVNTATGEEQLKQMHYKDAAKP